MEGYFSLISYFQTLSEPAFSGLASLSVVLNALSIDSDRKWKGIPFSLGLWHDRAWKLVQTTTPLD